MSDPEQDRKEIEEFLIEAKGCVARMNSRDALAGDKMILQNAVALLEQLDKKVLKEAVDGLVRLAAEEKDQK